MSGDGEGKVGNWNPDVPDLTAPAEPKYHRGPFFWAVMVAGLGILFMLFKAATSWPPT